MGEQGLMPPAAASFIPHGPRLHLRLTLGLWGPTWPSSSYLYSPSLGRLGRAVDKDGPGKHFIGDFLPPDELEKFMETSQGPEGNWEEPGLQPPPGAGTGGCPRPPGSQGTLSLFQEGCLAKGIQRPSV